MESKGKSPLRGAVEGGSLFSGVLRLVKSSIDPAAVKSVTQAKPPPPESAVEESLQSEFMSPQKSRDWTSGEAEDELISRWSSK